MQSRHLGASVFALSLIAVACRGDQPDNAARKTDTGPRRSELHVLFLGNSLTAVNDLPALVQAMAATGGVKLTYHAITPGGVNLEDHWRKGEGRTVLAGGRWDFVVLQQGPSSRPESQVDLREWAQRWADEARTHGATPALYMVWPVQGQTDGFKLVRKSYRQAAEASKSQLFPAGEAWASALLSNRAIHLYQADQLHPTKAGSYLAALVITQGLTGIRPAAIPSKLKLADGRIVGLPEAQAKDLRRAAESGARAPKAEVP